jgi:hypothetical protein
MYYTTTTTTTTTTTCLYIEGGIKHAHTVPSYNTCRPVLLVLHMMEAISRFQIEVTVTLVQSRSWKLTVMQTQCIKMSQYSPNAG